MNGYRLGIWICLLSLMGCQGQPPKKELLRPALVMTVSTVEELPRRSFPGKAKPVEEANLSFDVSGSLEKFPIKIGDSMKQGQLIAQLDQRDFIAKLNAAKAELIKNKRNLERAKNLVKKDFISKAEFDKISAAVDVSKSQVDLANKALLDSSIKAPFDGIITMTYVENFEAVRAKQIIARLLDISDIEMVINIPENLIRYLKQVKTVDVVYDAYPEHHFTARIKEVSKEASSRTRTYPITLIMKQSEKFKILPGMAGVAKAKEIIENENAFKQIVIPITAVFTPDDQKQDYVWLVDKNHRVKRKKVTISAINQQGAFIKKGLSMGDMIVVAGVHSLREGQVIKPIKRVLN